ncbi:MAG TPA: acyl carrier protein [Burkholderiales bacterium]|nr:acyl carrier protein [Burkholderiales bacterium]
MINESGYFSVPMISKLPKELRLGFIHKDTGGRYDVDLSFKRITGPGELEFEVKFDPPSVNVVAGEFTDAGRTGRSLASLLGGIAYADAAELKLPEGTIRLEKAQAGEIKQEVVNIVAREAKKPGATLNSSTEFTWANGFPYTVKISIVDAIERKFGFRVPDEHWQTFRTIGEVVDYTQKRVALDKFKSSEGVSWPEYQNQISKQAPLFQK